MLREQFNNVQSLTNPYGLLPGGVSPFPFTYNPANPQFILPASIYGISPNFKWPYTEQFNFSVQRQVGKSLSVTAAYVGAFGHRLPFAVDLNYPTFNSTATTGNVNNRRPIEPLTSLSAVSGSPVRVRVGMPAARSASKKGFDSFGNPISSSGLTSA